jgi:hypothetical protein
MSWLDGKDAEGFRIVGIGITEPTYQRLLQGEVIVYDMTPLGVPGVKLNIVAGRTQLEVSRQLENTMSARSNVHLDPRLILQGDKS